MRQTHNVQYMQRLLLAVLAVLAHLLTPAYKLTSNQQCVSLSANRVIQSHTYVIDACWATMAAGKKGVLMQSCAVLIIHLWLGLPHFAEARNLQFNIVGHLWLSFGQGFPSPLAFLTLQQCNPFLKSIWQIGPWRPHNVGLARHSMDNEECEKHPWTSYYSIEFFRYCCGCCCAVVAMVVFAAVGDGCCVLPPFFLRLVFAASTTYYILLQWYHI